MYGKNLIPPHGINIIEPPHKDPLNKKFPCPQCGNLFRTRQGLSGHIQFKHGTKQNTLVIAANDILELKVKLKAVEGILELPKSTSQMIQAILDNWLNIVYISNSAGINLNKQDFKNYFVARLADIYQS